MVQKFIRHYYPEKLMGLVKVCELRNVQVNVIFGETTGNVTIMNYGK